MYKCSWGTTPLLTEIIHLLYIMMQYFLQASHEKSYKRHLISINVATAIRYAIYYLPLNNFIFEKTLKYIYPWLSEARKHY